ncbi:hypothetical protein CDL15_Pgr004050 [Punica granatum]|uniref:HMA domain-containing protein n=1 Tax=Punica granatum TaxID=22663 RepID=A0A218XGM8_PUNGR|nr:hypothetical protein CDL15_Pgr004050 [Punica granatum]PKI45840.1 hypothetical protein CRG98_033761 [Punica granatum]
MKQKIALKVHMQCVKCKSKALQVAAKSTGVSFVGFEGEKIVVKGDGVDAVELAIALRKKVGQTEIVSIQEDK